MSILRSEDMGYYNLMLPHESSWAILNELGKISALQFVDLNSQESVFNRNYASYIKRCEEAERKIRNFEAEQKRFDINLIDDENVQGFLSRFDEFLHKRDAPPQTYLEELERVLQETEQKLQSNLISHEQSLTIFVDVKEQRAVLKKTRDFFSARKGADSNSGFLFQNMTGVIKKSDVQRFKRMVFRASRGNALTEIMEIEKPFIDIKTNEMVERAVFLILYREGDSDALKKRLNRITDSFGGKVFHIPNNHEEYEKQTAKLKEETAQAREVLYASRAKVVETLQELANPREENLPSVLVEYRWFVLKDKAIYHYLNMFADKGHVLYGECWCPISLEGDVRKIMESMETKHPNLPKGELKNHSGPEEFPHDAIPPSYFNLNEFTTSFQEIIDTYGTPNYKEANPALFSIFTFPFLFGVMFGDIGHGGLLFIFSIYLCWAKDSLGPGSLLKAAVPARYLLLLMGFCAFYNGAIYNDFFSIPLNLFGTKWENNGCTGVYPFGMDPEWYASEFDLLFFNSFKMKIAVIFGVIQMICGTLFRGSNAIHYKNKVDFFFEFVPQLVFMSSIFGYMIIMIFIKWNIDWSYNWANNAPNLITVLMNMFLKFGALDDQPPLWGDVTGQESLQFMLLSIGLIAVPFMLIPKPLILKYQHEQNQGAGENYAEFDDDPASEAQMKQSNNVTHAHGKEFNFSEVVIHQVIETIEFVLNAVSNTASYLRLWALSLAHAQLSEVFFDKAIGQTMMTGSPVLVVVGFFVFANVTLGVLMSMDVMECFLHALRLHWVEFMGKFYTGDGKKFEPLSFTYVLTSGRLPTAVN